ncbi:peptidoglycan D,D-transpeptidase FtsI family protein [Pseudomonadota bacterium]
MFIALILRLISIYIPVIGNKEKLEQQKTLTNKNVKRIPIVDRNNNIIAMDINIVSLYVQTRLVESTSRMALKLSEVLNDTEFSYILDRLNSKSKQVLIKRNITPKERLAVEKLGFAGLIFEDRKTRIYPLNQLLSHFIGYTDVDNNGLAGLEKQYDEFLKDYHKEKYLKTTIDIKVQGILREQLALGMLKFNGKSAVGIVMDVNNGDILGMVSLPDFNPNRSQYSEEYQRFNRATYGVYEMGSIFKIFTAAMALQKNIAETNSEYNISEPIKIGKYVIKDKHFTKNNMTVKEIIGYSSNVGTAKIAIDSGPEIQKEYFKKFGFLNKINADFPSLGTPIMQKRWGKINVTTMSYGHGIAVTPLHITKAFASIVNDGFITEPRFIIKESINDEGKIVKEEPTRTKILDEQTSKKLKDILRFVVTHGTGWRANTLGYLVGGKTGTAEKVVEGEYSKTKTRATFICTFPITKPQYVIFIMIDDPDGEDTGRMNTGGAIAAPIASKIIEGIAPILGVKPVVERIY